MFLFFSIYMFLLLQFSVPVTCLTFEVQECKSAVNDGSNGCQQIVENSVQAAVESHLCKSTSKEKFTLDSDKTDDIQKAVSTENNLDFFSIKKYAKSIYEGDASSNDFLNLYPFLCKSIDDTLESGVGSLLIFNGFAKVALNFFTDLIKERKDDPCVLFYVGRANVYRKLGIADQANIDNALEDYKSALHLVEGKDKIKVYTTRAEFFSSLGRYDRAFDDYNAAIQISPSYGMYLFRGISLVFMEKYAEAYGDLQESLRLNPHQTMTMHYLATCLYHMRRMNEAINMYEAVFLLKPRNIDIMRSLAQAHNEVGNVQAALDYINKAAVVEPSNTQVISEKGQFLYNYGYIADALTEFRNCVSLEPFNRECRLMVAKCHANMGHFYPAIKEITKVTQGIGIQDAQGLHKYPSTMFLREWCRYLHLHLDFEVTSMDVESDLHKGFKENWTRDGAFLIHNYTEQPGLQPTIKDVLSVPWDHYSKKTRKLLCYAVNLGKSIHLQGGRYEDSVSGNVRAYLASGLASIEIGQLLPSLLNAAKSNKYKADVKPFTWKDAFNIAVKWIRFVDLDKPLFWIDDPSSGSRSHIHRYGLIQYNQTKLRYEKYYSKFYNAFLHQSEEQIPSYDNLLEPQENFFRLFKFEPDSSKHQDYLLYTNLIGSKKISLKNKIEGYTLALNMNKDAKLNLIMEVGVTRLRIGFIHDELDFIWQRTDEEFKKHLSKNFSPNGPDLIINLMISLSYYFLNLMPLSHSTTIVSHTTVIGLILAIGRESTGEITTGKDLSLEALLSSEHEKFRNILRSWLTVKRSSISLNDFSDVIQTFPTYRSMVSVMQNDLRSVCNVD